MTIKTSIGLVTLTLLCASALFLAGCGTADAPTTEAVNGSPVIETGADGDWAYNTLDADVRAEMLSCGIDADGFDFQMRLPQQAFDQDFDGGWRRVAKEDGCENAAGELILAYMHYSTPKPPTDMGILRWHAGQMKASARQTDQAIALFSGTYGDSDSLTWNLYVDATLAFLEEDLAGIETAYARLSAIEVSDEEKAARQRFLDENPNITMPDGFVTEPENLSVVRRLRDCFGKPYSEAYGDCS